MATEIRLPVLGENVDSATIVKILVHPGDTITKDQPIVELDTEEASVELPASEAGTVKDIRVKEGETIKVGQVILTLNDTASTTEHVAEKQSLPQKPQEPARPPQTEPEVPKQNAQPRRQPEPEPEPEPESERQPEPELEREPQPEAEPIEEAAAAAPSIRRMARELGIDIHAVKGTGPEGRISQDDVRNF